ncbi:MAG: protein adenylyltransferase SelO family protein, partial [Giesbergeria sp.]
MALEEPLIADPSASAPSPRTAGAPVWRPALADLGETFYTRLPAVPLPDPHWVATGTQAAHDLDISASWLASDDALHLLSGNTSPPGSDTLASVYSGHQFGVWAGQLGDGRALLLGEVDTPTGPMEVQLKGSGLTPYSRMGDGRAVLRSSIREFLVSEAMQALGIPTTRALALVGSPLRVRRETMETTAVITRAAPSFVRFGHFEHFAAAGEHDALRRLADHIIDRHYPECRTGAVLGNPYADFLQAVSERTA